MARIVSNWLKRRPSGSSSPENFSSIMQPLLFFSQVFGVMPVAFYASVYSGILIACTMLLAVSCFVTKIAKYGFKIGKVSPFIFYSVNGYILIEFLLLAKRWPRIMWEWRMVEGKLSVSREMARKNRRKIILVTGVVLVAAFTEHALSIVSDLFTVLQCQYRGSLIEAFFHLHMSFVFDVIPFSFLVAICSKWINLACTFTWNFMDLFIMLNATGLAHLFQRFNANISRYSSFEMPEKFWAEQRKTYREICDLVLKVDEAISKIILVSFSNNLFFICLQLLNALVDLPLSHDIYFWFSLLFLILRTCAVTIACSDIGEEAKVSLLAMRKVPTCTWCLEVKRLCDEMSNSGVYLSGKRYFYVTRSLLLAVARTIITYELILFNFNQDDDQRAQPCAVLEAYRNASFDNVTFY